MKPQTIKTITNVLSGRAHGMIDQLSKVAPSAIPGLTNEIDETTAALTDFARHQHETNGAEINAGLNAVGILIDNENELAELDKFFESGTGRGSRAHKMIRALLKIVADGKPETLSTPA